MIKTANLVGASFAEKPQITIAEMKEFLYAVSNASN